MPTYEGVDSSYDPPSVSELKSSGKVFSIRYVSTPGHAKNLTRAEADSLKKGNIDIGIVGEISASRALSGYAQGKADMQSWQRQVADLGGPSPSCIYMAIDFDATSPQMPKVLDYIKGGAAVIGSRWTGAYGSYDVIQACVASKMCHYLWQTYAWSEGRLHPSAQLYQYRNNVPLGSATVDLCRAYQSDYGQWEGQAEWWID